jgi:hypothetical protein
MYLIPIAWLYVALMMGVAEATNTTGTVLGGVITFVLYGVGPVALVVYLMGAPARRKAIKARDLAERDSVQGLATQESVAQPDAGGKPPAATTRHTVAPVRKEP